MKSHSLAAQLKRLVAWLDSLKCLISTNILINHFLFLECRNTVRLCLIFDMNIPMFPETVLPEITKRSHISYSECAASKSRPRHYFKYFIHQEQDKKWTKTI